MITISIDVTLLEKSRFKEVARKNGKTARFCELILVPTPNSGYGDYIVKQSVSKAERDAGVDLPILGNGKILERGGAARRAAASSEPAEPDIPNTDVPF
jgi:hypothetical protein